MNESVNNKRSLKLVLRLFLSLAGTVLGVYLVIKLGAYLLPFVIGWIISLIAGPLARLFERKLKIKPGAGSVITTVIVLLAVCLIIYFTVSAVYGLAKDAAQDLPNQFEEIRTDLSEEDGIVSRLAGFLPQSIRDLAGNAMSGIGEMVSGLAGGMGESAVDLASDVAKSLPLAFLSVIITIFSAYYFMAERNLLKDGFKKLLPGKAGDRIRFIGHELKKGVGGYFKAQLIIMTVIFAILTVAFALLDVRFGVLWASLTALLDFLPFFGTGFVLIPWAFFRVLDQDYKTAAILVVLYIICLVVHQVMQPGLLSDTMKIDPLLTLLFMFVGYRIGGILGIFIGLLIGMVLVNLYKIKAFDPFIRDFKELISGIGQWLNVNGENGEENENNKENQ